MAPMAPAFAGVTGKLAQYGQVRDASSADHGVAEAIARLGADNRMDEPAAQDALPLQPRLFHDPSRRSVLDVANGADPPDAILPHRPLGDLGQRFGHQPP